jgi:hypothetical protein
VVLHQYHEQLVEIALDVNRNWHTTEGAAELIETFAFHLCDSDLQYTEAERQDILLRVVAAFQHRVDTGKWEESGNGRDNIDSLFYCSHVEEATWKWKW